MSRKALLEHQIRLAFSGGDEMSLMGAVEGRADDVMDKRIADDAWTVGEILYHVAWCKIEYCRQGWGRWTDEIEKPFDDIEAMKQLLIKSNDHLLECLASLDEADFDKALEMKFHGESAQHFFTVMILHDTAHAAQIRATLRHCRIRTGGLYPVG